GQAGLVPAPTAPTDGRAAVERTPRPIPAPAAPASAPADGRAVEGAIPAPTAPAAAPTGAASVGAEIAMIQSAIAEIGTDAKRTADRAAMNAGNRQGRERAADDGMRLGNRGRDAIKADWQRSAEHRRSDEKLLHDFSSIVVPLIVHSTAIIN